MKKETKKTGLDRPEIPPEVQALSCLDPLTCGITGEDESLCEACLEMESWRLIEKETKAKLAFAKAKRRKRLDEAKFQKHFAEMERLEPLLSDLQALKKVYPAQFMQLLRADGDQAAAAAELILDLIGPFLDQIYETKKRRKKS